jgi:hypothetical protein
MLTWISSVSSNTWRAARNGLVVVSMALATIGGTNGRIHRTAAPATPGTVGINERFSLAPADSDGQWRQLPSADA